MPYVVVLRGPSLVRIRENEAITVRAVPTEVGPIDCMFRTHFVNEGFEAKVPRGVFVEIHCTAPSTDAAIASSINAASLIKTILSLSANASIGDLEPELVFDVSPDRAEHEFVQRLVPADRGLPSAGRWIDVAATNALLRAIGTHARADRLPRAIVHYDFALHHWRSENSTLALAHLWTGAEALTPLARARAAADEGVDDEGLSERWGIPLRDERVDNTKLNAGIRRRMIFRQDTETYSSARSASDGYEHSFKDFLAIWELASGAAEITAGYLRQAILELMGIPPDVIQTLLAPPFHKPFETVPLSQWIRGTLHGPADKLASSDQLFPYMTWSSKLDAFRHDETTDKYQLKPNENLTPRLADGVTFQLTRFEIRGPSMDDQQAHGTGASPETEGDAAP
jgi:hypothetical protein